MIVKYCTEEQMVDALEAVNIKFNENIKFKTFEAKGKKKTRFSFTLGVYSCREPGSRRGHTGRRVNAACWHAHGYFFEELFKRAPLAEVWSSWIGKWITTEGGNWEDKNIGSMMYPLMFSQACECKLTGQFQSKGIHGLSFNQAMLLNCPHCILDPEHYKADGTCLCFDKKHQAAVAAEKQERHEKYVQGVLPGIPEAPKEWFFRADQKMIDDGIKCWECWEPFELGSPYTTMELYDSPFNGAGETAFLHVENGEKDYDSCFDRLTDQSWADFRYWRCESCGRMICRQNPKNGWHTHVREYNDEEICLACYEKILFAEGARKEDFEDNKIAGMFLNDDEVRAAGFSVAEGFDHFYVHGSESAKKYCQAALGYLEAGYKVINEYCSMGIGGSEGYISMWLKEVKNNDED